MTDSKLIRDEFIVIVFCIFFLVGFLQDKYVYGISNLLGEVHGIAYGISSVIIVLLINYASRKRIL